MKIRNLRVNHVKEPMGYQYDSLTFSYVVEDVKGKKQTGAQIRVYENSVSEQNLVYDSGMDPEGNSLGTTMDPSFLKPYTRYFWTVTVQTDAGEEGSSEAAWFETAKLGGAWAAQWITCETGERQPIFSKNFALSKKVTSARLYITGLGLYHALLNGSEVTEEKLTPYYTDYNNWVQYQTYDVTNLLEKENHIQVTMGNGWYGGRFGFASIEGEGGYYGSGYKLLAELRVVYEDGSCEVLGTDDSWEVTRSNITFSNIYDGEHRDDTLPETAPVKAEILGAAAAFPVKERLSLPVFVQEEVPAIALLDTPAGEKVFDLGQNLAGVFSLHLKEEAGTNIHIQVGEVLQQGNFYRDNLRTALAEYWYVSDGTEIDLIPEFTFYGYRYVKVDGTSNLKKEDLKALVYYSDITPAGKMVTGDKMFNQLLSNIAWGQKGNFVDVPTDCPQRDERMGWTADTQVFVPTASFLTDSYAFYRKFLYELRMEQALANGAVPDVIPSHGVGGGCSVWGDAATIMPWMLYEYYGDKQILVESYDSMKNWVDYIRRVDQGDKRCWKDVFQYGDWLALDNVNGVKDSVKGGTDDAFIGYVYYMNSAALVKKAAILLGKEEDAKEYEALEKELFAYIRNEYYTPSGRCAVPTQTAYTLTLLHGLSNNEAKTVELLKKAIKDAGTKLRTGFVGTPMVARILSKYNEDKMAYTILHDEEYPGWLYEINLGATTVWERWNSMEADGSVSSTGMNSFNHYAYGSIGEWMFKTMGGISPDLEKPGFKRAIIRPIPDYKSGYADFTYDSAAGTYHVSWKIVDVSTVETTVTVPFDCTAVLKLPYAADIEKEQELTAGTYSFTYHTEEPLKIDLTVDTPLLTIFENKAAIKALTKEFPGVGMVPEHMRNGSLRQVFESRGNSLDMETEKKVNEILAVF